MRMLKALGLFLGIFLVFYLGWGYARSAARYTRAVASAESRAHTVIGREGYEYIFEPDTWVLLDKVKPSGRTIIGYVFRQEYLPFRREVDCRFPDRDICRWMYLNILYIHDQPGEPARPLVYGAILGALAAGAYLMLVRPRRGEILRSA